ncbi:Ent-kaurene oxidase-like protein [Purpureocillium lavendulum]|uniref:Ent-kaurene oxidase-like protein n=1 Tax=Purpureocillium lavendulum TaxID=1247861 RepID=A0AB34FKC2_9HYPO|nr:Ent-kaurene oxidase-like protein [Purpureocillium lavendulum]
MGSTPAGSQDRKRSAHVAFGHGTDADVRKDTMGNDMGVRPDAGRDLLDQLRDDSAEDALSAQRAVDGQLHDLSTMDPVQWDTTRGLTELPAGSEDLDMERYLAQRESVLGVERGLAFDSRCRQRATALERRAARIVTALRRRDDEDVYSRAAAREGHAGQRHRRFAGDHFLSNVDLIARTGLFAAARRLPKGAHLHIHYNACLPPRVLLDVARTMDHMHITSDVPLTSAAAFDACEIQFCMLSADRERPGDLFSEAYEARQTMRFGDFLARFAGAHGGTATAEEWLVGKMEFGEDEAHNLLQTPEGAWEKFNGRTRMIKGLFNYETAYRTYTRRFVADLVADGILYAEVRPNFMTSNQLYRDDGSGPIDNAGIMEMIIDEVTSFKADMAAAAAARGGGGQGTAAFAGIKVIYCTPRVFSPREVEAALDECFAFKQRWPEWIAAISRIPPSSALRNVSQPPTDAHPPPSIAGFDIMGEESKGRPLRAFAREFLAFQRRCAAADPPVRVPFLFHCGETLECGTATDDNLVDALLLGARRIGHGFALARRPHVAQRLRAAGVCLELCPISNEVLGLVPRVAGHAMYQLLAANVHCTVNSDNGAIFRSSLSHDFYQVMVGKADMDLFGWKQLVLWSIEHACLDDGDGDERRRVLRAWEAQWDEYLRWLVDTYGELAPDEA